MSSSRVRLTLAWGAAVCAMQWGAALHAGDDNVHGGGRLRKAGDPAEALGTDSLSDADVKTLTGLFERISSADFDERQKAEERIMAFGPRAAAVAQRFEASADVDTRAFARRFRHSIILSYRGYLPVTAELKEALAAPRRLFIGKRETFRSALERFLKDAELTAAFGWKAWPERIIGGNETLETFVPAGDGLQMLLKLADVVAVPRGSGIAIATSEQAKQLLIQERAFAIASLDRIGRGRMVDALQAWLPTGIEVRSTDDGILVRGREGDLRIAARAIYFVAPDALEMAGLAASSRIFPAMPDRSAARALFAALESPVEQLSMPGIEPLRGIARLRAAGHPIAADDASADLAPRQPALNLELRDLPLGLALRWLSARANRVEPDKGGESRPHFELHCSVEQRNGGAKPVVTAKLMAPERKSPLPEGVLGADVAFLYTHERGKLPAAEADRSAAAEILKQLGDEVALFPGNDDDFALTVINKRLLARGAEVLLARLDELIENWRGGAAPARAKWRAEFDRRLEREIDWNGTGQPAGTLLQRLREASGLNILLERTDLKLPAFKMELGAAELFPPGKRSPKELLQRLCEVSKSVIVTRWGVVVLIPAEEAPQVGPKF